MTIQTTAVNATRNHYIYDYSIDMEDSIIDSMASLYRFGRSEYGRCSGKVYVDKKDSNESVHIGYVFIKKAKYEDVDETYLQETWLSMQ